MTVRRALAKSEHKRRIARRRRQRQALIGLVAIGVTTLTVVAVAMDRLLRPGAFPIKELHLEGEFTNLNPNTVRATIVEQLGDNYFSLDLKRIEHAVESLPWVYQARVRRSWPDALTVRVEEQHPVARWGEKDWLNADAEIIQLEQTVETEGLVSLRGPNTVAAEAWGRYQEWSTVLRDVGIEIGAIEVDGRFAWSLELNPGKSGQSFRVLLGLENLDQRMRRFLSSYPALQPDTDSLLSVDLRYPNGMAVTWHDAREEDEVALKMRLADE